MIVGGVPENCENHAERILNIAIAMIMEVKSVLCPVFDEPIRIRIGIHTGPVMAGVVGQKMPRYCLFGETVSISNLMESNGSPSRIHVSSTTQRAAKLTNPAFVFSEHRWVDIKGKGQMCTYFLERNNRCSVWELIGRPRSSEQTIDGYYELHDSEMDIEKRSRTSTIRQKSLPARIVAKLRGKTTKVAKDETSTGIKADQKSSICSTI